MATRKKTRSTRSAAAPTAGGKLVGVIRVSKKAGREGESFMSPADQRKTIQRYATANGAEIVEEFDETDSISGSTTDRIGLNAAVDMVLNGEADGLIVAKVNRFARTLEGGLQTIRRIRAGDKRFIAVEENIDSSRNDHMSNFLMGFMLLLAEWQLEQLTEGWENTRERHIENGVANGVPFGYKKDKSKRLVKDDEYAKWVLHIFTCRAAGMSYAAIAADLEARGVPTPQRVLHDRWVADPKDKKEPAKGGERWGINPLRSLIHRRTYLGELRSGDPDNCGPESAGFLNDAAHDPIVPLELWDRAHLRDRSPAQRAATLALLTGLVRCSSCGMRMTHITYRPKAGTSGLKTDKIYPYYRCQTEYSWGRCPAPVGIRADHIEPYILSLFEKLYVAENLTSADGTGTELAEAHDALRQAQAKLKEWYGLPSTGDLRQLGDDGLLAASQAPLVRAIKEAREIVAEIQQRELAETMPPDLHATWPGIRAAIDSGETTQHDRVRSILSLAFPAIAVWKADHRTSIDDRVLAFDPESVPKDLPGRAEGIPLAFRPIERRWAV